MSSTNWDFIFSWTMIMSVSFFFLERQKILRLPSYPIVLATPRQRKKKFIFAAISSIIDEPCNADTENRQNAHRWNTFKSTTVTILILIIESIFPESYKLPVLMLFMGNLFSRWTDLSDRFPWRSRRRRSLFFSLRRSTRYLNALATCKYKEKAQQ